MSINQKNFIVSFFAGFFIHLLAITNDVFNADYLNLYGLFGGGTYLGRWGIEFFNKLVEIIGYTYRIPTLDVLLAIIILSFVNVYLLKLINIKNIFLRYLLIVATMASPSVVNTVYFSFAVHLYAFSLFMYVLSVYYFIKKNNVILSCLCLVVGISIYQAYLPYAFSLYVIIFFEYLLEDKSIMQIIIQGIKVVVLLVLSFIIYFSIFKILDIIYYDGRVIFAYNTGTLIPSFSISDIYNDIVVCYEKVLALLSSERLFAYNNIMFLRILYGVLFSATIIFFILSCIFIYRKKTIMAILLFAVFICTIYFLIINS